LPNPVSADYDGPKAWLKDVAESYDRSTARFFVAEEIDGVRIENALHLNRQASHGQGFHISAVPYDRVVPARPLKIKLVGTQAGGAPIQEILARAAGQFVAVEGVVDFTPTAGRSYRVNGMLLIGCPSVWIEDSDTRDQVSAVIQPTPCK
jgi:hypothetical protein